MLRLALKNLAANKVRLGLTAFAIVLGVGFVVSSFVLRDGLKETFASLSEDIVGSIDISIEAANPAADPLSETDLATVRATSGVAAAEGDVFVQNLVQPIKSDGTTISLNGPPQVAFSWPTVDSLNSNSIETGRAPAGPGEWIIDFDAADRHDFIVGETYELVTPDGKKQAELVGTFRFGEDNETTGATLMAFELETAQEYFAAGDRFDTISVSLASGATSATVEDDLSSALGNPGGPVETAEDLRVIVQNRETLVSDAQADFNLVVDIFGYVLLAFALIALFVSIFIIANTFAIVTSQRVRELGLMRAVGATPSQVRISVVAEAFVIGFLSAILGLVAGVGIAYGLREILDLVGIPLPPFGVNIQPLTVIVAFVIGIGVTVVSAVFPAIAAARISPITAITGTNEKSTSSIGRYVIGGLMTALAVALLALGLFAGDGALSIFVPVGFGAALLFVGITLLSPTVAGPLSRLLGAPLEPIFGRPGSLATENAARNPRRTATTAAALMIGLSLVSLAFVLGASLKAQFTENFSTAIQADYFVISNAEEASIPAEVVAKVEQNDAFTNVAPLYYAELDLENEPLELQLGAVEGDGYSTRVLALDYEKIDGLFELDVTDGKLQDIGDDQAAIRTSVSEDLGVGIGDTLNAVREDNSIAPLEIVAIYDDETISEPVLVSVARMADFTEGTNADWVAALRGPDASIEEADAALESLATEYPNLEFQSSDALQESVSSFIDGFLNFLTGLVGLAIFIALIGIANTMALSVFERYREIGLLRAVGMTRRQTRRMIRWEAAIISAVGAVLGALIGVALGALIVAAIPDEFLSITSIPILRIVVMVLIAAAAGLIAALFPAWRASRLNVLEAITHN